VSALTAGTGIFATLLSQVKPSSMNFPLLLSMCNYVLCATYLLRPTLRHWSSWVTGNGSDGDRDGDGDGDSERGEGDGEGEEGGEGEGEGEEGGEGSSKRGYVPSRPPPSLSDPFEEDFAEEGTFSLTRGSPAHPTKSSNYHMNAAGTSDAVDRDTHQDVGTSARPSMWWYAFAAFCDLEANYLIISAFNYTTFTSVVCHITCSVV